MSEASKLATTTTRAQASNCFWLRLVPPEMGTLNGAASDIMVTKLNLTQLTYVQQKSGQGHSRRGRDPFNGSAPPRDLITPPAQQNLLR